MTLGMIPATWNDIRELVADALDADPADRAKLVRDRAGSNLALLKEAMSLLNASERATGVIDPRTDIHLGLGGPDVLSMRGQSIGRYRLEELVGEGAMSAVYRAWQISPKREVAIKLFRSSITVVDARARFNREAQALARLSHPNIATIYESGLHPCGTPQDGVDRVLPFIAMEFVRGSTVTEYAKTGKLSVEERVKLIVLIARAVHAAHQQAVIHCDLKPANVLIQHATKQPKVLDFGIARITAGDASTLAATAGVLLGTPGYMSPEQASSGDASNVDVRSDVWALGVMLFELLSGQLPLDLGGMTVHQTLRAIETQPPRKLGAVAPELPRELQTICEVALSHDKAHRFGTAEAMADDLERFLRHEPLRSRPPGTWIVIRNFTRRNRGKVLIGFSGLALLAGATVASSVGFVRANNERAIAQGQREIAQQAELRALDARTTAERAEQETQNVNQFLLDLLSRSDNDSGGRSLTVYAQIQRMLPSVATQFKDSPGGESKVRTVLGRSLFAMGEYDAAREQFRLAWPLVPKDDPKFLSRVVDIRLDEVQSLRWLSQFDDAHKLLDEVVELHKPLVGTPDDFTINILSQQAGVANEQGDNEQSIALYLRLIELQKKSGDSTKSERLTAQNNLAMVYNDRSQFDKAIEVLVPTIAGMEELYGKDKHSTLTARSNLAYALAQSGNFERAADEFKTLALLQTPVVGASNPSTVNNWRQYAMLMDALGHGDEALRVGKEQMDVVLADAGTSADQRIRVKWTYSMLLANNQRWDESIPLMSQAVKEIGQQPDSQIMDFDARGLLGEMLGDSGKYRASIDILLPMIEENRTRFDATSSREIGLRLSLCKAYLGAGEIDNAVAMSQTLMPLYPTLGGSKVGAAVHRVIARTLVASGKPMEALPHLEEMDRMLVGVKQPKSLASSRRAWDEYRQAISK